ncbi:MAG: hypothetical protein JSS83_00980 [Cyanobacteria bacterium SZAS LIN-3]|nr:hypothetical protein [Cyanobacteria bacterium SZAS LIN-3]
METYNTRPGLTNSRHNRLTPVPVAAVTLLMSLFAGLAMAAQDDDQTTALTLEYNDGKYDQAFNRCIAILKANNANMTAHYYLGNLYLKYKRFDQSSAEYNYCVAASKDPLIVEAAKKGLQAVEQNKAAAQAAPTGSPVADIPQVDPKVQEQIDRLKKEAADQIAIKKKVYDLNIERATQEMHDQYPRYIIGGQQGRMAWNETKKELEKERQGKLDRLRKQFDRDSEELQAACDKRVNDILATQANLQKLKAARH